MVEYQQGQGLGPDRAAVAGGHAGDCLAKVLVAAHPFAAASQRVDVHLRNYDLRILFTQLLFGVVQVPVGFLREVAVEDVGLADQGVHDAAAFVAFKVQEYGLLAAELGLVAGEGGVVVHDAGVVDLEHFGAVLREQPAGRGACDHLAHVQDLDALEGRLDGGVSEAFSAVFEGLELLEYLSPVLVGQMACGSRTVS